MTPIDREEPGQKANIAELSAPPSISMDSLWRNLNVLIRQISGQSDELSIIDDLARSFTSLGFLSVALQIERTPKGTLATVCSVGCRNTRLIESLQTYTNGHLKEHRIDLGQFPFIKNAVQKRMAVISRLDKASFLKQLPERLQHFAARLIDMQNELLVVVAPVVVDENAGYLIVLFDGAIRPDFLPPMTTYTNAAAATIREIRHVNAMKRQEEQVRRIWRAEWEMMVMLERKAILQKLCDTLRNEFDYFHVWSGTLKEDGGIKAIAFSGQEEDFLSKAVLRWGLASSIGRVAAQAMQKRGMLLIEDINNHPDLMTVGETLLSRGLKTLAIFPVVIGDTVVGTIFIHAHSAREISEERISLIDVAISTAAIACQLADLLARERHQRSVAEMLLNTATLLNSTLQLHEILDLILMQLEQVVRFDSAAIMLLEGDMLTIKAIRGFAGSEEAAKLKRRAEEFPFYGDIWEKREPVVINDMDAYLRNKLWAGDNTVKSWAAIPLISRTEVIGVLSLDKCDANFFRHEDISIAQSMAQQAVVVIQNARLLEQERLQRQQAESLRGVAALLNSTLDLEMVLDHILLHLSKVIDYDSCAILLVDGDYLVINRGLGFSSEDIIGFRIPLKSNSPSVRTFHSRTPLVLEDAQADNDWIDWEKQENIHGWIGTPLIAGNEALGVLTVDSNRPGMFSEKQAQMVQAYADHAALAIRNARLYRQAEVDRRLAQSLLSISQRLLSTLDLNAVLNGVLESLEQVVQFDSASILLASNENHLHLEVARDIPADERRDDVLISKDEPIIQRLLESPDALLITNTDKEKDLSPLLGMPMGRSWIGVPLRRRGEFFGVLNVAHSQNDFYNEEHARLVSSFAAHVSLAIENARLYHEAEIHTHSLEERVKEQTFDLRRQTEQLKAVLQSAGDSIFLANPEGIIEYINPKFTQMNGFSQEEAIGQVLPILQASQPLSPPSQHSQIWATIKAGDVYRGELIDKRKDGALFEVELTIAPVIDEAGNICQLVGIQHDISERKRLERMKEDFLSMAAHELRTPLTTIQGFSEILSSRPDIGNEERMKYLRHINAQAVHMKELIDDLLDLSRIEEGASFTLNINKFELKELIEEVIGSFQVTNTDHHYVINPDNQWGVILADRERVAQVLQNLLSNATKYSPAQSNITITTAFCGVDLVMAVQDEGIGLSQQEQEHLFEKFWRANSSSTAVPGTGLGLVIVKHIVEAHGGRVWVESELGKGTKVFTTFPLLDHKPTVLIIEDEPGVRELEGRILQASGYEVMTAAVGNEGIKMAGERYPNLIMLDLMLPDMSGDDVMKHLEEKPATRDIPIVVVSAKSSWNYIEESYRLGAVDFLTKPFDFDELVTRVRMALQSRRSKK